MKTAFLVVTAALFTSGVTKTTETISARAERASQIARASMPAKAARLGSVLAPEAWAPKDPVDSLYREARAALAKGDYAKAADLFRKISRQYPNSDYAGEALYYQAFSEDRIGGTERAEVARTVSGAVGSALTAAVETAATTAGAVAGAVSSATSAAVANAMAETAAAGSRSRNSTRDSRRSSSNCPSGDDDDDDRIAALNALMQMDAERAMPILTKVLERRDACSVELRRKAVFLVSQKRTPETADILLRIARNDPDEEVREQAVFWLSQVPDDRAVTMLQEILSTSNNEDIKNKALFALSQHQSPKASQFLRDYALREDASDELRGQAIFWLGQRRGTDNAEFLRSLYSRVKSDEVKDKILFSLSQQRGVGNDKFLLDIARNRSENIELRKKALFWAGQGGASAEQLRSLYSTMPDSEMREQLIFVYSQRRDPAMVDMLLDIAKNDKDPELRKKAIFWLGQSHDPRVQQFLLDLINK